MFWLPGFGVSVDLDGRDVIVSSVSAEISALGVQVGDLVLQIGDIVQGRGRPGLSDAMAAIDTAIAESNSDMPVIQWQFAISDKHLTVATPKDLEDIRQLSAIQIQSLWRGYLQREDLAVSHLGLHCTYCIVSSLQSQSL